MLIDVAAEQCLVGDQRREMHDNLGKCGGIGGEAGAQRGDVRKLARREIRRELCREFGLAATLMCKRKKIDHQAACRFLREFLEQPVEGQAIGVAREQLVAVDEIKQRHGFAP